MFVYDKKIAYLYYKKRQELVKNAGHVKITYRAGIVHLEVYVRDMPRTLNGSFCIKGLGKTAFEDVISIENGQAVYKKNLSVDKEGKKEDLYGLWIELGDEQSMEAVWLAHKKEESRQEKKNEDRAEGEGSGTEGLQREGTENRAEELQREGEGDEAEGLQREGEGDEAEGLQREGEGDEAEGLQREGIGNIVEGLQREGTGNIVEGLQREGTGNIAEELQREGTGNKAEELQREDQGSEVNEAERLQREAAGDIARATAGKFSQDFIKAAEKLTFSIPSENYEDKWKELCKRYELVHPFGNKEEYLSIKPKDFIIFPEKYQHLANNSFLLHGYYNYRHVILGRKQEAGKGIYYLGVPGVYYEREKMVAIMFGFEGFECGEKKPSNGGFGYYMRRVEI